MTRTTLDIDRPLLEEIRSLQKKEGCSMGKVVSQLLAEALASRRASNEAPAFQWISRPMHPLVDISDKEALYSILDRGDQ